jgi:hypothetical protein
LLLLKKWTRRGGKNGEVVFVASEITKSLNELPQKASTNCHKKPQRNTTKSLNETPQKASTIMVNSNIFNTFASNNKLNPYGVFIENGRWVA